MITTNKKISAETEKWLIDSRDLFEEFDAFYELNGVKHHVTIQAQPADGDSITMRFLAIDNNGGQSYLEYDSELKGWIDCERGEIVEAKLIGAEIETHMQFDDSPQEDAGIDNPEQVDPSQPFTAWYKLYGKKHLIRIEPVFALPGNHYHIYNLDNERESDVPERILIYNSELNDWVEKDTEFEYNSWLDREKGYSLYSWIIGHILNAVQ